MSEEGKTYQPGWGEKKKHHHSNHYHDHNRGIGGALRMRDKQAYIGLMLVLIVVLLFGAYKLVQLAVNEYREMPKDNPASEMQVDALRIRLADEQDALLAGDSLAQELNVDSLRKTVQIKKMNVYRPPRQNNDWYINAREWKAIRKNYKIWRGANGGDPMFVIGSILVVLGIGALIVYAIYRHKHRND